MIRRSLLVGFGSGLGGLARYGVVMGALNLFGDAFPVGTLVVNVVGSAFIGLVAGMAESRSRYVLSPDARAFVAIGFCGGFTTYSFFAWQMLVLGTTNITLAAIFLFASASLPLAAVWAGHALANRLFPRSG